LLSVSRILEGEGRKGEIGIFVSKRVCPVVFSSIIDDEKSCGHLGGMTQVFFRRKRFARKEIEDEQQNKSFINEIWLHSSLSIQIYLRVKFLAFASAVIMSLANKTFLHTL
jgi:hypothetical protein